MGLSEVTLLVEALLSGNEGKQRKFGLVPKVVPEATTKTLLRRMARVW